MSVFIGNRQMSSRNIEHLIKYNGSISYATMSQPGIVSEAARAYNRRKPYDLGNCSLKRVKI